MRSYLRISIIFFILGGWFPVQGTVLDHLFLVEDQIGKDETPQEKCERILHKLWLKQGGIEEPKIQLTDAPTGRRPAWYDVSSRTIYIHPKAYQLSLGLAGQKDDILAFLIAHELIHAYQKQLADYDDAGFFVKANTLHEWAQAQKQRRREMETKADIWGAVLCYLAGYKVVKHIPYFIENLYASFQLKEEDPLYDSKTERMEIAQRAQVDVQKSILLFDFASYLSVLQHHDKDTSIYQFLIDNFKSVEFYNNLGLSYIRLAQPKLEAPFNTLAFPLVLDTDTRLEQAVLKNQLSPKALLEKSVEAFYEIQMSSPDYLPMRINRATAHYLLSSLDDRRKERYLKQANSDLSFVYTYPDKKFKAESGSLFRLKDDANQLKAMMSFPDLFPARPEAIYRSSTKPNYPDWEIDGVDLNQLKSIDEMKFAWLQPVSFHEQAAKVAVAYRPHSTLLVFDHPESASRFYLQRITGPIPSLNRKQKAYIFPVGTFVHEIDRRKNRRSIPALDGTYFMINDALGIIHKLDAQHKVLEFALFRTID